MSTNINKYGTAIHSREFLIAPVTSMDTPIETSMFSYSELDVNGDPTGITLYHSVNSHEAANPNRTAKYTKDNLYFIYGMSTSDLKNDTKDMKTFIKTAGIVLGTEDFTANLGNEFWVLNLEELEEWLSVNPHNL